MESRLETLQDNNYLQFLTETWARKFLGRIFFGGQTARRKLRRLHFHWKDTNPQREFSHHNWWEKHTYTDSETLQYIYD